MSILETKDISKQYPGTLALNQVSVSFESGKINALVGKNGSGKSTLVNIFSGAVKQTSGKFLLDGEELSFSSPEDAQNHGVATVYQELSLIPGLSVAENIFIGRLPVKGFSIDWKKTYSMAKDLLDELEIDISPKEVISNLTAWQCQMVEIAKAMSHNPKILQLDEPTSSLAQNEVESLFKIIRNLKKKDVIIIYITHKLQELSQIADNVTVLRDGKLIGVREIAGLPHQELINMMFGNVEIKSRPADLKYSDEVILDVRHISDGRKVKDASFQLHKGEVLGIAGMLGSGRTELLNCIFGAQQAVSGEIYFQGEKIEKPTPAKMNNLGLAMTQEDRKRIGLNLNGTIGQNLCYASLNRLGNSFTVDRAKEKQFINRQVNDLAIKVSSTDYPVSSLSGGNQQKVVVGNWLNIEPRVILFDEPSRGIDVNAKQQIFKIVWDQAARGISSVIVSTELEELIEVCHTIVVMRGGKTYETVLPEDITIEKLYSMCMGE